jgi:hypothetical protein
MTLASLSECRIWHCFRERIYPLMSSTSLARRGETVHSQRSKADASGQVACLPLSDSGEEDRGSRTGKSGTLDYRSVRIPQPGR